MQFSLAQREEVTKTVVTSSAEYHLLFINDRIRNCGMKIKMWNCVLSYCQCFLIMKLNEVDELISDISLKNNNADLNIYGKW